MNLNTKILVVVSVLGLVGCGQRASYRNVSENTTVAVTSCIVDFYDHEDHTQYGHQHFKIRLVCPDSTFKIVEEVQSKYLPENFTVLVPIDITYPYNITGDY